MSQKVNISESDSKLGYLVQNPGWFQYKTISVSDKPSEKGDTHNYFVEVRGLDKEMTEVSFIRLFNTSKGFKSAIVSYFKANNSGVVPPGDYDFEDTVGMEWEGYTERGKDGNGNIINDIKDFRPIKRD